MSNRDNQQKTKKAKQIMVEKQYTSKPKATILLRNKVKLKRTIKILDNELPQQSIPLTTAFLLVPLTLFRRREKLTKAANCSAD